MTTGTGQGSNLDYTVNTASVMALFRTPAPPDSVEFTLNVDGVVQEESETFTLQLVPNTTLPTGESVFFRSTLSVTIINNDSEWYKFGVEVAVQGREQ